MADNILDLRGLSCPQPVFETKKVIEDPRFDSITVLVDNNTALENIKRLLESKNMPYTVEEGDDIKVNIKKG